MTFACPHCGATKNRLREIGPVEIDDEPGPDMGFVFCNACTTLIVWEMAGGRETVRRATADETMAILATPQGQAAHFDSLLKHMATRR